MAPRAEKPVFVLKREDNTRLNVHPYLTSPPNFRYAHASLVDRPVNALSKHALTDLVERINRDTKEGEKSVAGTRLDTIQTPWGPQEIILSMYSGTGSSSQMAIPKNSIAEEEIVRKFKAASIDKIPTKLNTAHVFYRQASLTLLLFLKCILVPNHDQQVTLRFTQAYPSQHDPDRV